MHDIVFAVRIFPVTISEPSPLASSVAPPVTGAEGTAEDQGAGLVPSSRRPLVIVSPLGTSVVE